MQPVWFCIFSGRQFEDAFQNAQWRKAEQMQPLWLCILSGRQFEEAFENAQLRKVKKMQPVWLCMLSGRRLPYSTDSYFHILIFVFVSWVGGGDPPWVPAKSLSLHGGQKIQARTAFFFKIGVMCVFKGCKCKKNGRKRWKTHRKKAFSDCSVVCQ